MYISVFGVKYLLLIISSYNVEWICACYFFQIRTLIFENLNFHENKFLNPSL